MTKLFDSTYTILLAIGLIIFWTLVGIWIWNAATSDKNDTNVCYGALEDCYNGDLQEIPVPGDTGVPGLFH